MLGGTSLPEPETIGPGVVALSAGKSGRPDISNHPTLKPFDLNRRMAASETDRTPPVDDQMPRNDGDRIARAIGGGKIRNVPVRGCGRHQTLTPFERGR
ncbi:MAG: hypothetical protein AB7S99_09990 [Pseudodonghicola sp.]